MLIVTYTVDDAVLVSMVDVTKEADVVHGSTDVVFPYSDGIPLSLHDAVTMVTALFCLCTMEPMTRKNENPKLQTSPTPAPYRKQKIGRQDIR